MGKLICLDTEYDARYSDRGVSRLSCMTYCEHDKDPQILGYRDAVEQWVEWARDPSIKFLTHSGPNDFGVLADEAHLHFEGELPEHPGLGPYWELAHRLYDDGRVIDTETSQRLTHIRFGPHKASVQLGALAKQLFGIDASDAKSVPDEAKDYLRRAVPYSEWPEELLTKTPWRVKFGLLRELYGNDVSRFPLDAIEYALDDAALPWRVFKYQRRVWGRPIPNLYEQTLSAWVLHLVSIPGWKADRERAQAMREVYQRTLAKAEDVLLEAGVLEVDGPRYEKKSDKLKGYVFSALGSETPVTKTLEKACKSEGREPTLVERRENAGTDARTCFAAIAAAGGPDFGRTPTPQKRAVERAFVDVDATLERLESGETWTPLLAHVLRSKAPDEPAEGSNEARIAATAERVLVDSGVLELIHKRVKKDAKVRQRIFHLLGPNAPITDKGYELFGKSPTLQQRFEYCSTDSKSIRAAILAAGATPLEIADAVEKSEQGAEVFDAWLAASGERVLNSLVIRGKSSKTIGDFIDKLDTDRMIRTSYVSTLDTGRTSARGSGGPGTLNIQQLPRDYDKPKHLHVRGCIVPPPGWSFIVADYTQLELCALAHILTHLVRAYARNPRKKKYAENLLGFEISEHYVSTLAQAINDDQDCHVKMAATLRGLGESYFDCYALYEWADAKKGKEYYAALGLDRQATQAEVEAKYRELLAQGEIKKSVQRAYEVLSDLTLRTKYDSPLTSTELQVISDRQLAKPCNFGFPGGLGAGSFVDYAAGYGVAISPEIADKALAAYMKAWPEMRLYFAHIKAKIKDAEKPPHGWYGSGGVCVQIKSKRERGECSFTQWANGWFQGLAADGAKEAGRRLIRAAYRDLASPMFGTRPSGFIHDEYLVNARVEQAEQALPEVSRHMVEGMQQWIPDVKIKAPGKVLYERWGK